MKVRAGVQHCDGGGCLAMVGVARVELCKNILLLKKIWILALEQDEGEGEGEGATL